MKIFAFTTVYNEAFFLPRWVDYYASQLGREHVFVLDHGSTDGSTLNLPGVNILRVPRSKFRDGVKSDFASSFHAALLQHYDGGFVGDVDEFIVANPDKYESLRDFAERTGYESLCGVGLELLHIPEKEPDFQSHLPILSQRRTVFFNSKLCKHLFSRRPVRFGGGFHASTNPVKFDPDLFLFHLKHFDYSWRLARQSITRAWDYADDFGHHARWDDAEATRFVNGLIATFTDNVQDGFDFSPEIIKAMETATTYQHDSLTFFETDAYGFFGDKARTVPDSFAKLF